MRSLYQDMLIHVTRVLPRAGVVRRALARGLPAAARRGATPISRFASGCRAAPRAKRRIRSRCAWSSSSRSTHADVPHPALRHRHQRERDRARARRSLPAAASNRTCRPERLRRFFTRTDGGYRINKQVRDLCVFARQDLTRDPPFSRLDLIMCRNVLIYMDAVLQKKLVHVFHYALNPTGFLDAGPGRDRRTACRAVQAGRQEVPDLSQAGQPGRTRRCRFRRTTRRRGCRRRSATPDAGAAAKRCCRARSTGSSSSVLRPPASSSMPTCRSSSSAGRPGGFSSRRPARRA